MPLGVPSVMVTLLPVIVRVDGVPVSPKVIAAVTLSPRFRLRVLSGSSVVLPARTARYGLIRLAMWLWAVRDVSGSSADVVAQTAA